MENKLKRSRKSLKKISGHGLGGGVGGPYITLSDEVGYVEVKLLVKRKVEAGLALHGLALFLRNVGPSNSVNGISRKNSREEEGDKERA
jgi:hypothetical protein